GRVSVKVALAGKYPVGPVPEGAANGCRSSARAVNFREAVAIPIVTVGRLGRQPRGPGAIGGIPRGAIDDCRGRPVLNILVAQGGITYLGFSREGGAKGVLVHLCGQTVRVESCV